MENSRARDEQARRDEITEKEKKINLEDDERAISSVIKEER